MKTPRLLAFFPLSGIVLWKFGAKRITPDQSSDEEFVYFWVDTSITYGFKAHGSYFSLVLLFTRTIGDDEKT